MVVFPLVRESAGDKEGITVCSASPADMTLDSLIDVQERSDFEEGGTE